MAAYVIADIAGVTDAEKIAAYRELSTRATAAGGGRFVARGGQDDAEVEAGTRDGRAERGSGGEDAQVPQVRVRVEAGDADLSDEGDNLSEEGAAKEGEHLREDARAGGAGRCVRHGLI